MCHFQDLLTLLGHVERRQLLGCCWQITWVPVPPIAVWLNAHKHCHVSAFVNDLPLQLLQTR
ncbi:unnamed protein product [Staurois parvus]|uniref:Uncharacterized protein n=1 Tax=Staurois parvus TaxID=386267 RepID=A0ABN9BSB7_9NEOB|nr:unnamed protein product [Staurois parvus]